MFVNEMPRYEILSEEAMSTLDGGWRRIVSELGVEFVLPEAVEYFERRASASRATRSSSTRSSCSSRWPRRRASSSCRRATPSTASTSAATAWPSPASTDRRSCARATSAATRRWPTSRTSCGSASRSPRSTRPAARRRAGGHPARLAPPRHGLRAPDALGQALHGLGDLGRERARHDRDGEIAFGGERGARAGARLDLADQLQLAAALGRPHAQRDARVQPREPGGGRARRSC